MLGKQRVTMSLLLALAGACASQSSKLRSDLAPAPGDGGGSVAEPNRRELTERALARLGELESETTRVANRLIYEGTVEQRAAWDQELHAIEHDRKLLTEQLREAEVAATEEWASDYEHLTSIVDVLIIVGNETAAQIDRALDADRAAARARSAEPGTTATE